MAVTVFGGILVAKRAASLLGFFIGVVFWTSASADAYLSKNQITDSDIEIDITGEITQRDVAFFRSLSKEFEFKQPTVRLNSPGGDVAAAMEIGRIIRSVDGSTRIESEDGRLEDGRCYSSCALIFIAGVWRNNYGDRIAPSLFWVRPA
jgi:ATP-dependent protease ClpP protease subunit